MLQHRPRAVCETDRQTAPVVSTEGRVQNPLVQLCGPVSPNQPVNWFILQKAREIGPYNKVLCPLRTVARALFEETKQADITMNCRLEPFWEAHEPLSASSSPRNDENAAGMSEGYSEVRGRKLNTNFF